MRYGVGCEEAITLQIFSQSLHGVVRWEVFKVSVDTADHCQFCIVLVSFVSPAGRVGAST